MSGRELGARILLRFPCHPIPAHGSLTVPAIDGCIHDLHSTSVVLWQGKGPFNWAAHQILGVLLKKVSFGACNAHTSWNWTEVGFGDNYSSLVNNSFMLTSQFPIENQ